MRLARVCRATAWLAVVALLASGIVSGAAAGAVAFSGVSASAADRGDHHEHGDAHPCADDQDGAAEHRCAALGCASIALPPSAAASVALRPVKATAPAPDAGFVPADPDLQIEPPRRSA